MERHPFKLGMRLARRETNNKKECFYTVMYISDKFLTVMSDEGLLMQVAQSDFERTLYTQIPTLENK